MRGHAERLSGRPWSESASSRVAGIGSRWLVITVCAAQRGTLPALIAFRDLVLPCVKVSEIGQIGLIGGVWDIAHRCYCAMIKVSKRTH